MKNALKQYGKRAVIAVVMKKSDLLKTINGENIIKKLKKVGFEEVEQRNSHVTMGEYNGNNFCVCFHNGIKT